MVPQVRYRFKHALVQEAAYDSLLQRQRQAMHHRIAQVLETHFPDMVATQPEVLAHHYTKAALPEQAIPYWQRAGQQALEHSAYQEATGHLSTALDLLSPLPDSAEHRQQELEILPRLGASLRAIKGSPDAAVLQVYQRLRDLGQQSGEPQQMVPALRGLLQSYRVRGDLQRAQDVAEQLLHLSHGQPDLFLVSEAHKNLGLLAMHLGDLVNAHAYLEQGMHATTISEDSVTPAFRPGVAVGVSCRNFAALVLWMLGYPAQALQCSQEARALARRLSHPQSLVAALNLASRLHQHRREIALAREYAEASLTLASEHALTHWMILGRIQRGSLLAAQGQITEGFSEMRQGLTVYQARGARVSLPIFLAQIAEVCGQQGQTAEGLRLLSEAQRVTQQGGERSWEAEQYRLQGELLL
jgi:tetratricopeptide (TPR) repeat protein